MFSFKGLISLIGLIGDGFNFVLTFAIPKSIGAIGDRSTPVKPIKHLKPFKLRQAQVAKLVDALL